MLTIDLIVEKYCSIVSEEAFAANLRRHGVGAEALSGLARAFFYAGARSLVVSHWDVLDDETALLMSDLFKRSSQNKNLSHGEALQQVQLDMLNHAKNNEDAHPRVWAPFVVVGEPAKLK